MQTSIVQRAYKFTNVELIDESEFPAYRIDLSATEVEALVSMAPTNVIDLDPMYQRGTVAAKNKAQDRLVHSRERNMTHIESIRKDLIQTSAGGRSMAILPPIWVNARHSPGSVLKYDPTKRELFLMDGYKLFVFDGWHRILAACGAVREGQLSTRRLTFYVFDAPVEFEARAFRTLNYKALPVDRTRVAWVSSPFTLDLFQVAREFVEAAGLDDQLEVTSPRLGGGSEKLCTFLTIVNGILPDSICPTRWADVDPTSTNERQLVINYLMEFWMHLENVRPELMPSNVATRKQYRRDVPVLLNSVTIQSFFALAYLFLQCYRPTTMTIGETDIAKLRDLDQQGRPAYDILFDSLIRLRLDPLDATGTRVDFFALENPIWAPLINSQGKMSLSGYGPRNTMFNLLKDHMGIGQHNSISTVIATASAAPRNRITAKKLAAIAG